MKKKKKINQRKQELKNKRLKNQMKKKKKINQRKQELKNEIFK